MPSSRHPRVAARLRDVVAVAVVVLLAVVPFPDRVFHASGLLILPALLPAAALVFRRRWPFVALGVSLACTVGLALTGVVAPGALIAVAISAFSVTDRVRRAVGVPVVAAAAVVVFVSNAVPLGELFDPRALQFLSFVIIGAVLGDATSSRRQWAEAMRERAERAEHGREEEALRRVAEERVRIARDLHDVVAHQISVISLNAGVASSALPTRPERAQEALATIRSASRTVLTDIGGLMALLRDGDPLDGDRLRPRAGLGDLHALIAGFTEVGMRIDARIDPVLPALPPAADLVAYLAVQEGLTNAFKHGDGVHAELVIDAAEDAVSIRVVTPTHRTERPGPAGGHGLRGLRERVAAVRGNAEVQADASSHRLLVSIPTSAAEER